MLSLVERKYHAIFQVRKGESMMNDKYKIKKSKQFYYKVIVKQMASGFKVVKKIIDNMKNKA